MGLIKNDIPILEYDTNDKAIIMPGHSTDFHFPERAVMLFMEKEIDDYAVTNECEIIGQLMRLRMSYANTNTIIKNVKRGRQTGSIVKQKKWWNIVKRKVILL